MGKEVPKSGKELHIHHGGTEYEEKIFGQDSPRLNKSINGIQRGKHDCQDEINSRLGINMATCPREAAV